ncbi:M20 aminoacylase family protein [Pelagibacterium halotolerans]|uniref:N-acetyl-L,L-diaminopimelate deacetylase n=1 Tax=Pelagibacterium halotolerans (strain DSM 22347 / JCM 15775 / CGMCC 1.7692 / B2) TaxID=1082931 RepID=G4R7A5_PELHB|nr:M20 aminoacylase family protein [Pelagibacterium halotolerans]AEQ51241.1 N-acetyl-L,L-diaminopimelate deacetylase [Pelagibacterium halotolerans B2]QJR18897.1 amidohydrolase [Pelagibacterium halotolerans]SEA67547.1 hippurate hydrolase [Pelagibacterium halotolerans]
MPIINSITEMHDDIVAWRRDFHAHPELLYDVDRTAGKIAQLLESFGVDEVVTGIGRTGVVGVIRGRAPGRSIGLRADMDALPINEATGLSHASTTPGLMHACGHDGHSAMLLGAARHLALTRNFDGTIMVIFQPAEEGGAGGLAMAEDGLFERFGIEAVYGMHNLPGLPEGSFATCPGAIMASADEFDIEITARGGHAAWPHEAVDPVLVAGHMITALQSIVARNIDPLASAVISTTRMESGSAYNVIPGTARLSGTVRTLAPETRDTVEARMNAVITHIASAFGASAKLDFRRGYPVTVNDADQTRFACKIAQNIVGPENVNPDLAPMMGGEDFAFMLERRPGAYVFIGNGPTSGLHTDTYDFNDEIIPVGVSYLVRLGEAAASGRTV